MKRRKTLDDVTPEEWDRARRDLERNPWISLDELRLWERAVRKVYINGGDMFMLRWHNTLITVIAKATMDGSTEVI